MALVTITALVVTKAALSATGQAAAEATVAAIAVTSGEGTAEDTLAVIAPIPTLREMKARALAAGTALPTLGL
jgi:hypothetical protein